MAFGAIFKKLTNIVNVLIDMVNAKIAANKDMSDKPINSPSQPCPECTETKVPLKPKHHSEHSPLDDHLPSASDGPQKKSNDQATSYSSKFLAAKKKFDNQKYELEKTDCSAAVREVYPEFSGMNSDAIKKHLDASSEWNERDSYQTVIDGDVLHFPGHVEIVTGRGFDHLGRPSITTWGCRTMDSQAKNSGCGAGVFSDEYLTRQKTVVYGKDI